MGAVSGFERWVWLLLTSYRFGISDYYRPIGELGHWLRQRVYTGFRADGVLPAPRLVI